MSTLSANRQSNTPAHEARLSDAQTGNGVSTNIVDLGPSSKGGLLRFLAAVGATPTCTYLIEGSTDGTNWVGLPYYDSATPTVKVTASTTFAITSASTVKKIVRSGDVPFRYLRVTMSANTNVTTTIDFLYSPAYVPTS